MECLLAVLKGKLGNYLVVKMVGLENLCSHTTVHWNSDKMWMALRMAG